MIIWKYVKPINNSTAIDSFLAEHGINIPADLLEILKHFNGGRPSQKRVLTSAGNEYVFKSLLSYNSTDLETIYNVFPLFEESTLFPVGSDAAGNFICFDQSSGKYALCNHENDEIERIVDCEALNVSFDDSGCGVISSTSSDVSGHALFDETKMKSTAISNTRTRECVSATEYSDPYYQAFNASSSFDVNARVSPDDYIFSEDFDVRILKLLNAYWAPETIVREIYLAKRGYIVTCGPVYDPDVPINGGGMYLLDFEKEHLKGYSYTDNLEEAHEATMNKENILCSLDRSKLQK